MIVIPLVPFIAATISFYSTTFLPLLLQHVDYFHISQSELGKATSTAIVWSQILPLIFTPFLTYVYEILGRRIPIIYSLFCSNLLFWLIPKVAPNYTLLCLLRAIIGLNNTLLIGAPLISDAIKHESRGKAVAISVMAIGLSMLFGTQFLVPITKNMNFE